jgi:hypothetical protein
LRVIKPTNISLIITQITLKDAKKKCEEQGMVVSSLNNPTEYKSVSEYF